MKRIATYVKSSINTALTKLFTVSKLPNPLSLSLSLPISFSCTNTQYPNKPDKVDADVFAIVYIVAVSLSANYAWTLCDGVSSKENEVLQFPGFSSDTPFATDPATACIIIKEQTRAEPDDENSEASRRESSKVKCIKLSYKQKRIPQFTV